MRTRRALVLAGAGASIDFGAPSTDGLTDAIEAKLLSDPLMRDCGGDRAWTEIKDMLSEYFEDALDSAMCPNGVNFEHIYHCAHELIFTFEPTHGAVREYRPILVPFIERRTAVTQETLRTLIHRIAEFDLAELSAACEPPIDHLASLGAFVARLKEDHVTRIYTTNYDDFFLQADRDLYTGFNPAPSSSQKSLDRGEFWSNRDRDCVFHLHGSVHLSFGLPPAPDADLGALYWYDDRAEALRPSSHGTSDDRRMDGSGTIRTPIITGLDKLSPLQRQPFSHYYASMARDAMDADIIYVIGCGLADLHLNTWLGEARRRDPKPPLIFVDFWRHSFPCAHPTWTPPKEAEMIHTLRMPFVDHPCSEHGTAWHLDRNRTYAVWDSGFLRAPAELDDILRQLR